MVKEQRMVKVVAQRLLKDTRDGQGHKIQNLQISRFYGAQISRFFQQFPQLKIMIPFGAISSEFSHFHAMMHSFLAGDIAKI